MEKPKNKKKGAQFALLNLLLLLMLLQQLLQMYLWSIFFLFALFMQALQMLRLQYSHFTSLAVCSPHRAQISIAINITPCRII
jgi:hypothetical protein